MGSTNPINRRQVLAAGATAATIAIVPRHVLGGAGQTPPSEKLNIAGVGIGGRGGADLKQIKGQNIVALADVDWGYAAHLDNIPRRRSIKTSGKCSTRRRRSMRSSLARQTTRTPSLR